MKPTIPHDTLQRGDLAAELGEELLRTDGYEPPAAYTKKIPVTSATISEHSPQELPSESPADQDLYEPRPERTRVKLDLWHLVAEVTVELDARRQCLFAWRNRTEGLGQGGVELDKDAAVSKALEVLGGLPANAHGPHIAIRQGLNAPIVEVSWVHLLPDHTIVHGDKLVVRLNGSTGRPCTLFRKWRTVPPEQEQAG